MVTTESTAQIVTPDQSLSTPTAKSPLKAWIDQNLIAIMGGAAILSLGLSGVSIWNTWNAYQGFKNEITKQFNLQHLSDQIVYLDEVLTMSARMAASTGNTTWEDRYNKKVGVLDQTLKDVSALAPSYTEDTQKTDAANQRLVQMETDSFALVRQGQNKKALELLLSPEYEAEKKIYSQGVNTALTKIQVRTEQQLQTYREGLFLSLTFTGASLPILLISWGGIIWTVRSYIRDRDIAQQDLLESQSNLINLNQDLEEKSRLLFFQEQTTREENEVLQYDIGHLLDVVSAVEQGELTIQAEVNERMTGIVADTLNRLIEELAKVLFQVLQTAEQVTDKAKNLEDTAEQVALKAQLQSNSATHVLQLSEQVQDSVFKSSAEVDTANQFLNDLKEVVGEGQGAIARLSEGIEVLQQGSERIIQQMKTLGEFVALADQFVSEQSEIAQQTQILALNASLVAARAAGQQGSSTLLGVAREFEGIAEQVSRLASSTTEGLAVLEQQTRQIHTVVQGVDAQIQGLGGLVGGFREGVDLSTSLFNRVELSTQAALKAGQGVQESNAEIVTATEQTVAAMGDIALLAQQTAKLTQNTLAQSELMEKLTARLLERIQFFQLPSEDISQLTGFKS